MTPNLLSIRFHHPDNRGLTLPLRRLARPLQACPAPNEVLVNEPEPIPLPEWQAGVSRSPKDSPVAICLSRVATGIPLIRVGLAGGAPQGAQIRALDASGDNLLGVVVPTALPAFAGETTVDVRLDEFTFAAVAAHDDVFQWQWRETAGQPWQDLRRTRHRVCVTLDIPQTPWDAGANAPWIEVLDQAAQWAAGAIAVPDVASRVTRAVFALGDPSNGHPQFTYGNSHLTSDEFFDAAAFLSVLSGCQGEQCLDCGATSSIVTTFANSLGARLLQAPFRRSDGADMITRPIRCLGQAEFRRRPFLGHEVALAGAPSQDSPVFDACLLVSRSDSPEEVPHGGVNATGMRFGTPTDKGYLWRFASPESARLIQFDNIRNRQLGSTIVAARATAEPPDRPRPGWFYWNFRLLPEFLGWSPLRSTIPVSTGALTANDALGTFTGDPQDKVKVVVESHACHGDALHRLRQRQSEYFVPLREASIGDFALITCDETAVLMVRGNLFIEMHIAGPVEQSLFEPALAFDQRLIEPARLPTVVAPQIGAVNIGDILPAISMGQTMWYRVHTNTGEIRIRELEPIFYSEPGTHDIYVYKYDPDGQMTSSVRTLQTL